MRRERGQGSGSAYRRVGVSATEGNGSGFALRSEIEIVLGSFIIAAQERLLRDNSEGESGAKRVTEAVKLR